MQTELGPRDRGLTALRQGDTTGAVALLTEALRLDPADADACSALGVAFCQTQRPQDGVRALRRAVELRPDRAPLTFNLARGLEMTGQPAAALESYRRTLELDPRHQSAAQGVQRLSAVAAAPPPPVSDFLLTPAPAPVVPHPAVAPVIPPRTAALPASGPGTPAAVLARVPEAAPAPVPQSPAGHPTAHPPQPKRGGSPWGIVAVVLGVLLLAGIAVVAILAAVVFPAVQQARHAAERARERAELRANGAPGGVSPSPFRTLPPAANLDVPQAGSSTLDLSQQGGGPGVRDGSFGFDVDFPAGFPGPTAQRGTEPVGMGGTASRTMYQATVDGRLAYVIAYAFAPEVYEKLPQDNLFQLGQDAVKSFTGQVTQSSRTQFKGHEAQDLQFSTTSMGASRQGRGRIVLAQPRVLVVAFESPEQAELEQAGVTSFLDSLSVQENVYPPDARAPIQMPSAPTAVPSPPGLEIPSAPNRDFTPPSIPEPPRITPPDSSSFPTPPGLPEGFGRSRFGPGGPRFMPRIPRPSFGPPTGETPGAPGSPTLPQPEPAVPGTTAPGG